VLRNGLEPWHLIIILAAVVLLFGSKKLPDTARGLGQALRIFKAETKALDKDNQPPAPIAADRSTSSVADPAPEASAQPAHSADPEETDRPGR
jgi:sec-independent protein translocase protein TatA